MVLRQSQILLVRQSTKNKITNSNGDLLLHLDGTQTGIGTVGVTTTGTTFHVDRATGEITFELMPSSMELLVLQEH